MTYIVVMMQIVTYVLFILALVLTHNSERRQCDLNKKCEKIIKKLMQENADLRSENEELDTTQRRTKRMISNYETNKTNPYTLIRDIKRELDNSSKSF